MFKNLRIMLANLIAPSDFGCMSINNLCEIVVNNKDIPKAQYDIPKKKEEINNAMGINFGLHLQSMGYADIMVTDSNNEFTKEPTVDLAIRAFIYLPQRASQDEDKSIA